ncbi:hypothetical protein BGZ70_006990 [Mortierella alpina]|uniref:Uncharacterized protein n=1 Tax=Mortierella alpina TaxID=64518 RepID=A0A9P6J798_MORAP|nr:hypothetical protein BGZ70_006990 [Mortierella alpina]
MTPHAPNLFALSAGVGPSCDTGPTAEYYSGSTADLLDPTTAVVVDKKRARPPEEATRARKKVASELMAFEHRLALQHLNTLQQVNPRVYRASNIINNRSNKGTRDNTRSTTIRRTSITIKSLEKAIASKDTE